MNRLVATINQLQDVLALLGPDALRLPQIVVVGDQNSGKSSLLEGIIGKSFLPRGIGTVTRRPLILQIIGKTAPNSGDYAVFQHNKDRVYKDFHEVKNEIIAETERELGKNKRISGSPIILKMYLNNSSNFTVVDLPGIVKMPVGDQPSNIEQIVKDVILKYIRNPISIILAIVPANTDIATSESLKLAREVDPNGDRSLAVVTKLDLMDSGTDASDILCGKVIPMKLGIIGVVNRSQQDTNYGRTLLETLKNESTFLHDKYPTIAEKNGTAYLTQQLYTLLLNHIEKCLPDLKELLNNNIIYYQNILKTFGEEVIDVDKTLLELLAKFSTSYSSTILGTNIGLETSQLSGGARINYIFNEIYGRALENMDPLSGFTRNDILTAIKNCSGTKPSLFIPESCFELLVKKQIQKLEAPSLKCVCLVHEELERMTYNCGPQVELEMARFPKLHGQIAKHVTELLKNLLPETNAMVRNIVVIHTSYINTGHPDFVRDRINLGESLCANSETDFGRKNLQVRLKSESTSSTMSHIDKDCFVIETLVTSYFNIVRKSIQDTVPKTIMHFLVNRAMDKLLSQLVNELHSRGFPPGTLEESPEVIKKRNDITSLLNLHYQSINILNKVCK